MYIPITFLEDLSTDYLKIGRKISCQGGAKVYKTYLDSKKKSYALKMFPNDNSGTNQYKKEIIISDLSHPNIIKYIPATIEFPNDNDFHCILTEYAKYGRLFDMVSEGVITSEVLVRTYFHQIVAGLGYIHSQGFAHLDLKLENLMLGSGFELKIIDFDLAQGVKEKKITSGGTNGYRAPEVIDGSCTNFKAADIYSLGIILYTLKAQSAPFTEIRIQNAKGEPATSLMYYSTFLQNNSSFWELRAAQKNDFAFFSEDFKKLINGMLEFDVSKRSTIGEIRSSKWFNGPILTNEELRAEMKARWRLLKTK